jgi:hypothetical protein
MMPPSIQRSNAKHCNDEVEQLRASTRRLPSAR